MGIALGSFKPFHHSWNCYWCGYLGWILAILAGTPSLYLHGSGFVASLFQGVSHQWTGEAANLPELSMRTGVERAADELAHVSYFPVLILHSACQSLAEQTDDCSKQD